MPGLKNSLIKSVGDPKKGAANRDEDVKIVQGLLNLEIVKDNRSDRLLEITGHVNDDTLRAVIEFQRRRGTVQSGVVEPRDGTANALENFSGPRSMRTNQRGIDLIKQHYEKLRLHLYDTDGASDTTIGYGHLVHKGRINDREPEEFKQGISEMRAEQIFRQDLGIGEDDINRNVQVPLTQNQFDALASFVFNVGPQFDGSTLLKLLNEGDYLGATKQFEFWHYARHKPSPGLPSRRREERALFERR